MAAMPPMLPRQARPSSVTRPQPCATPTGQRPGAPHRREHRDDQRELVSESFHDEILPSAEDGFPFSSLIRITVFATKKRTGPDAVKPIIQGARWYCITLIVL